MGVFIVRHTDSYEILSVFATKEKARIFIRGLIACNLYLEPGDNDYSIALQDYELLEMEVL